MHYRMIGLILVGTGTRKTRLGLFGLFVASMGPADVLEFVSDSKHKICIKTIGIKHVLNNCIDNNLIGGRLKNQICSASIDIQADLYHKTSW